ncbi:hypothetical protein Tsubulata_044990 [Turnera subulata]|uniref:Methyltransferase domain-containing protein n=1 Tax=Turnera subulata TaxID=218843 RepID=A0A9Q0G0X6_9ROSI|nr:hypothetical protein Tsubulata_044990 [Turnera subulata]
MAGGETFTFQGINTSKCSLRVILRVHNPQFYWKLIVANREANKSVTKVKKTRWTPMFPTALISSSKLFLKHVMRQNSLTQARRNISRHYDLSNEVFAMFMDETMTYSCALFKEGDEDLKVAQNRKISVLIGKARIDSKHEVLEMGCGWGSFAIEVVKQTGCKYTGITLSKEQLKFAEAKAKEAGLQDRIRFLLCDYRELPDTTKYDRIISWQYHIMNLFGCFSEIIEHVGHEYMEAFFGSCESLLAEDGLLVLQHVENIGPHYYHTLRCWRKKFLKNQREVIQAVLYESSSEFKIPNFTGRGWWSPMFSTAIVTSSMLFFKHAMRQNSLTQARRNISRHYDLGNEIFALFMDETMTYSCALFKARIENKHEVLEIGCGWGMFAIEVVKQTGCKYTGINLSKEQLKFAEMKVKEAGLQFISVADAHYDELRRSPGFMAEYIFPGGCIPSLSRVTSAMAAASKLCKIVAMGFDEKLSSPVLETLRH